VLCEENAMRNLTSWALRGAFAVVATCGFVRCQHEVPGPTITPPHEAPPVAPRPGPMPPVGQASPCIACPDGGMPIGPGADLEPVLRAKLGTAEITPASVSPQKPPLDAGTDGPVSLPPIPDGGPVKVDAGQPLSQ
jgi:hypothetical protein